LLYVEHAAIDGSRFLHAAEGLDLEGVVGKFAGGVYQSGGVSTCWVKVLNREYSQAQGRHELFQSRGGDSKRSAGRVPRLVLA
jgi:ATP-dependent DNA ligase